MEFCEGGKINDLKYIKEHYIPVNEVSKMTLFGLLTVYIIG